MMHQREAMLLLWKAQPYGQGLSNQKSSTESPRTTVKNQLTLSDLEETGNRSKDKAPEFRRSPCLLDAPPIFRCPIQCPKASPLILLPPDHQEASTIALRHLKTTGTVKGKTPKTTQPQECPFLVNCGPQIAAVATVATAATISHNQRSPQPQRRQSHAPLLSQSAEPYQVSSVSPSVSRDLPSVLSQQLEFLSLDRSY